MAVTAERVAMEGIDAIEKARIHFPAESCVERDAGFRHASPLAFGLLALLGGESLQKGVEARVPAIRPVELAVLPQEPACRPHRVSRSGSFTKSAWAGGQRVLAGDVFR